MKYITTGKKYNTSKIAKVECKKNDSLKNIDIKGERFLLIFLEKGSLAFSRNEGVSRISSPAFICFDESKILYASLIKMQNIIVYIFILIILILI